MNRAVRKLRKLYPDITWTITEPERDIIANFGKGDVLQGNLGSDYKEFYILDKDKNKVKWGIIIANLLQGTVK